jgi:hypothetical protein
MLPPLPRCSGRAHSSLKLAHPYQPSPKPLSGRPAHRPFRGLLGVHSRCGLHTRAVTKTVTVIRRLQTLRHLHACSGRFRLERSPGGACTRWKSAALSRRTWEAVIRWLFIGRRRCAQERNFKGARPVSRRGRARLLSWPGPASRQPGHFALRSNVVQSCTVDNFDVPAIPERDHAATGESPE